MGTMVSCGTLTIAVMNSEVQEGMGSADLSLFPPIVLLQLVPGIGGKNDSTS